MAVRQARPGRTSRTVATAPRVLLAVLVLLLAGCGSSGGRAKGGAGTVNVLYAGSLVALMRQQLVPGFHAATGGTVAGFAGGSTALATQIKDKVHAADVFISADPGVNASLRGAANGAWVSWYADFAASPLVLGYDPKSRFAQQLRARPWYQVITEPGFRLGRTDPATDPKGVLAVTALRLTAAARRLPALADLAGEKSGVFPEETLVGRLQAGQLDAGFFYRSEAVAAHLPTVPLTGTRLSADYTVTVVNRAPHERSAEAFVRYLLGAKGRALLARDGFTLVRPPTVHGSGVPRALRSALPGG